MDSNAMNAPSLILRPAEDRDVPTMAAIRAAEWETQEYWERRIGNYLAGNLGAQHALPGHAVFVAELDGIDVVQAHRRHGIAGQMVVTLAAWFIEQQALRVCIDVQPKNLIARGLYAKFGARPLNPHWMFWEDIHVVVADTASPA